MGFDGSDGVVGMTEAEHAARFGLEKLDRPARRVVVAEVT
jgi:hypothetical protein